MVAIPSLTPQHRTSDPGSAGSVSAHEPITAHPIAIRQPLAMAVARRAVPLVAAAASAALTTLAVERAVANFALRSIERTPFMRRTRDPEFTRITVTHTTIVERIRRPS
ncbi:MAG: hypothetical protein DWG80_01060 [Chloroflexi bacterium]|nr:hypothetical protein [Chloroflexota bacterium]MQC17648.1 hypothetical protein [Chloroflexota bacterium]